MTQKTHTQKTSTSITLTFFLILTLFAACTTNFDITADYKPITIIYALLNPQNATQYIRINKAFLGDNNAYTNAQIADSLYYNTEQFTAKLEAYNQTNQLINTINLEQTNAATENIQKNEGIFASQPYFLYKTTQPLNPNYNYKIIANDLKSNTTATATTPLIPNFEITKPDRGDEIPLNYNIRWQHQPNAAMYDAKMYIYYTEQTLDENNNLKNEDKVQVWNFLNGATPNSETLPLSTGKVSYNILRNDFLNFLAKIPTSDKVVKRYFKQLGFEIQAAAVDFKNYNEVLYAQQNSISSAQIELQYSNVQNGKGLFSARTIQIVDSVALNINMIDSMACSPKTAHLKFATSTANPNYPNCN